MLGNLVTEEYKRFRYRHADRRFIVPLTTRIGSSRKSWDVFGVSSSVSEVEFRWVQTVVRPEGHASDSSLDVQQKIGYFTTYAQGKRHGGEYATWDELDKIHTAYLRSGCGVLIEPVSDIPPAA